MRDQLIENLDRIEQDLIKNVENIQEALELYDDSITPDKSIDPKEMFQFNNINKETNIAKDKIKKGGEIINESYTGISKLKNEILETIDKMPNYIPEHSISNFVEKSNQDHLKNHVNKLIDELVED